MDQCTTLQSTKRLFSKETSSMVYKSLNGLAPDNFCQILSKLPDVHTKCNLAISQMRIVYGQQSLAFCGANL